MLPDAECVRIVSEILSELEIGEFVIKVRHHACSFVTHLFENDVTAAVDVG